MHNLDDGFGIGSMQDVSDLRKALDIGTSQPATGVDGLRVESLELTLKLLTYQQTNLKLWNQIPKLDAYSTVEEYNRLSAYGSDGGGFTESGELPQEEDSTYERADQKVKYLGTTRSVNHPSTLVRSVPADMIAQETQNGALWLMGKANHGLYYGDADVVPVEWNGITQQIEGNGGHVIDLQGAPLTKDSVEEAAYLVAENFGQITNLYSNGKVFADFSDAHKTYQQWANPNPVAGLVGTPTTGVRTTNGDVMFQSDVFVKEGATRPTSATSTKAPNAPTLAIGSPGANAASKFVTGDNGNYKWAVAAVNKYGVSAASALSASTAIALGDGVVLTITDGGGTYEATGYYIYRTEKGGSTAYKLYKAVPRTKTSGVFQATTAWTDINEYRPNTYIGLGLDTTIQSLSFKQLSPMVRMPLAIVSPSIRWMQLMYGTPIVYAPKRNVVFKNIGKA